MGFPVYMVPSGDVLPIFFSTYDGGTGASITMTGLAITDVEIYKDTSMTQRASDAGVVLIDTDGIDLDTITGIHGFSIDTGDNTDAGFYAVGAWYHVVVSAITVDAQTVNFIAAAFRIMAAEGVAGVPDVNTTHIGDTVQTANDVGADVDAILVDTAVLGAPAGASIAADIAAIEAQTDDIGVAGAGLTAIPTVAAIGSGGITAASFGAGAIDAAAIAANAIGAAEVADGAIDAATFAAGAINAAAIANGAIDAATFAAGAVDAAALAADAVAEIADGVWDEARSGHTTAGSYGASQSVIESAAAVTGTLSTTQATTDLSNATDDAYNGRVLIWKGNVTAALKNQATDVTDYVGATKLLTFTAITTAPANGDEFELF